MKSIVKSLITSSHNSNIYKIKFGIASGIKMEIDYQSKYQRIIGLDEKEIQYWFVQYAKKSNYFFDIGASDGYYSLIYKKYNPSGKLLLFEPLVQFKEVIQKHFRLNTVDEEYKYFTKFVSAKNNDTNLSIDKITGFSGDKIFFKLA